MSINLSHDQNLITDENSQTLPSLSYRLASAPLFPSREKRKAAQKNLVYTLPEPRLDKLKLEKQEPEERWYNQITYSYSSRLENQREEKLEDDVFVENYRNGIQHSLNFNAPQNVAKYINLTPTLSYNEDWFSERRFWYYDANGNLKSRQERGFFQRRTFSTSLTSNTKFYGYFNLNLGSIRTIRHVVTPSLQFSYRPDFGVPMWGSYQQVDHRVRVDDHWELQKSTRKDRYEGSIFGGSSRGKMMSMGISLGNLFQMKRVTLNEKGEEKEEKTELFTYNTSTSYNFVADSLKFSPLTSSFRASPIRSSNKIGLLESLSIDISTRHSFYQFKYDKNTGIGREVDRFYWEESGHGLNLLRMTSFSTTSSFSLSGQSPFAPRIEKAKNERETELETGEEIENLGEEFDARFEDPSLGRGIRRGGSPWKLSGSIRYNLNLNNPRRPLETLILNNTVSLNLTKKWSFTYSTGFNLKTREVISSNLSVVRDLHCWEGRFTWSPMGLCQGFYLRLGIKTAQLRDVQLEQRRGSTSSGLGSLGF